jgi:hypothetical protein
VCGGWGRYQNTTKPKHKDRGKKGNNEAETKGKGGRWDTRTGGTLRAGRAQITEVLSTDHTEIAAAFMAHLNLRVGIDMSSRTPRNLEGDPIGKVPCTLPIRALVGPRTSFQTCVPADERHSSLPWRKCLNLTAQHVVGQRAIGSRRSRNRARKHVSTPRKRLSISGPLPTSDIPGTRVGNTRTQQHWGSYDQTCMGKTCPEPRV